MPMSVFAKPPSSPAVWSLSVCLLFVQPAPANAGDADDRHAAVAALGELNGVALQCRYLNLVRRMKQAVVDHAPKERSFGLAFDQATNEAFLAFARNAGVCPTPVTLASQVDEGVARVAAAFTAQ